MPALTPIDASRPFIVYAAVQGTACGDGAAAGALEDLFRVSGADGFVAAVVERQRGGDRCVTITARPFTYGCTERAPTKLAAGKPMHVVPGPTTCPTSADACTPDCTRYAGALGGGEFETAAFRERCVSRCRAADDAFMTCARAATTPDAVRRCDAT